jgi:hypothetical protein
MLVLIDLLHEFVQKHTVSTQEGEFFKFIRFEILCLTDSIA